MPAYPIATDNQNATGSNIHQYSMTLRKKETLLAIKQEYKQENP